VPPFALSVLKYALLALLYFFIYRAVRSVAVEVSGRGAPAGRTRDMRSPQTAPARTSRGGRPPTAVVIHEPGGAQARTVRLSQRADIGRADACTIRLQDTYVSQMHARLAAGNGAWTVEDLGSTNGTFLNDRRVTEPVAVHAGDVVRVGKTVLELRR
jgi:pSer/pThr/pTyr-binding forkhead associated (FHA) protein